MKEKEENVCFPGIFSASWRERQEGSRLLLADAEPGPEGIPERASAVLTGISRMVIEVAADAASRRTGLQFASERGTAGDFLPGSRKRSPEMLMRIKASRAEGEASREENALTGLLLLLALLPLEDGADIASVRTLVSLLPHGDTAGRALGLSDAVRAAVPDGKPSLRFSRLHLSALGVRGEFCFSYPAQADGRALIALCEKRFRRAGFLFDGGGLASERYKKN